MNHQFSRKLQPRTYKCYCLEVRYVCSLTRTELVIFTKCDSQPCTRINVCYIENPTLICFYLAEQVHLLSETLQPPRTPPLHTYRYPDYEVYSDATITSLASKSSTRYSADAVFGLIFDITILSECDFLVCTFSSNVSQLSPSVLVS